MSDLSNGNKNFNDTKRTVPHGASKLTSSVFSPSFSKLYSRFLVICTLGCQDEKISLASSMGGSPGDVSEEPVM